MEFISLKDWLERLKAFSEKEKTVVLVEGKKDKQKLEKFGISHIYSIKGKKFYDILEELENENLVIILTDLDKQGEKISSKISSMFQREGIPVDLEFREYLKNFDIKHIEDIPVNLEEKIDAGKKNYSMP
ncbi:toprim domain-containing protein [Persephonella sp. KM09-Lau-8]|uniref:toprim domain-containing protein n=1 Tax=Persephonella sp. KM09-Lau-8 TaxID=1158345 RepID=UPI00068F40D6|nr:toprim domain-containing protein [Persephonella sp. KM09-Lau-8]